MKAVKLTRVFLILCLPPVGSLVDYTVRESGLQLDQPPAVGYISSLVVLIQQNDNVEGVLEFRQDYLNVTGKIN